MNITHRNLTTEEQMKVIAWHEDSTRSGNYVLTLETSTGRHVHAIERADLTPDQIHELKTTVKKDSTGL
jgi:hypothetical protein